MKFLAVEDDEDSLSFLKHILARKPYDVDYARTGREALELLRQREYTILLTDWMMPEMDGIELIRQVRREFEKCPFIIMVSAMSTSENRKKVLDIGADDYIEKPYSGPQVLGCVEKALERLGL